MRLWTRLGEPRKGQSIFPGSGRQFRRLAGMKKLEELDVRGTPVSDAGLAAIRKTLPTLRVIR